MNSAEAVIRANQLRIVAQLDEQKALKKAGLGKVTLTLPLHVLKWLEDVAREKDTCIEMVAQNLLGNVVNQVNDEDGLGYAFSHQVDRDLDLEPETEAA